MTKSDKLSVLFSFKNEERNIRKLVKRTTLTCNMCLQEKLISEYEIIFVDDASDDKSNQILNELYGTREYRVIKKMHEKMKIT